MAEGNNPSQTCSTRRVSCKCTPSHSGKYVPVLSVPSEIFELFQYANVLISKIKNNTFCGQYKKECRHRNFRQGTTVFTRYGKKISQRETPAILRSLPKGSQGDDDSSPSPGRKGKADAAEQVHIPSPANEEGFRQPVKKTAVPVKERPPADGPGRPRGALYRLPVFSLD